MIRPQVSNVRTVTKVLRDVAEARENKTNYDTALLLLPLNSNSHHIIFIASLFTSLVGNKDISFAPQKIL